jgi:cellulose synthase (UDP-forming)
MPSRDHRLIALVVLGVLALVYYLSWWSSPGRYIHPWAAAPLALAAFYNFAHLVGSWILYCKARSRSAPPPPPADLTVDVMVTACREPVELIERSLSAACAVRGEHRTWLLDDGDDPALEDLARRLGAGYLTRSGSADRKAGNLNAALAQTSGDIVVIFDADHAPTPDFLERSLGYFADPRIGFVQVMLTFVNANESWIARAASESTIEFYNPTQMGADANGSATLIGSNALIRRSALESIGGYRPGLAEDLATSVALHAAGWRSAYVAEPLAPGLVPADIRAWCTQQLKWARGVFEVLLVDLPRFFRRLTWTDRLTYGLRVSYYWIGCSALIHFLFTVCMLTLGSEVSRINFQEYAIRILPLAAAAVLIRHRAVQVRRHETTPTRLLWRPMALVLGTWPIHVLAWCMAVVRVPLGFRLTPKRKSERVKPRWLLPQVLPLLVLAGAAAAALGGGPEPVPTLLFCVAALQAFPHATVLWTSLFDRQGSGAPASAVLGPVSSSVHDLRAQAASTGWVPGRSERSDVEPYAG